jgi:hypothetical protein
MYELLHSYGLRHLGIHSIFREKRVKALRSYWGESQTNRQAGERISLLHRRNCFLCEQPECTSNSASCICNPPTKFDTEYKFEKCV